MKNFFYKRLGHLIEKQHALLFFKLNFHNFQKMIIYVVLIVIIGIDILQFHVSIVSNIDFPLIKHFLKNLFNDFPKIDDDIIIYKL